VETHKDALVPKGIIKVKNSNYKIEADPVSDSEDDVKVEKVEPEEETKIEVEEPVVVSDQTETMPETEDQLGHQQPEVTEDV